jgi:hypothetical protein
MDCFSESRIPRELRPSKSKIILEDTDTYTVSFWRVDSSQDWHQTTEFNNIFWDMLHDLIETETDLCLSF